MDAGDRGIGARTDGAALEPHRRVVALLVERLDRLPLLAAREGAVGLRQHVAQLLGKRAVGRIERRQRIGRRRRLGRRHSRRRLGRRGGLGRRGLGRGGGFGRGNGALRLGPDSLGRRGAGIRRGRRRQRRRLRHRDGRFERRRGLGVGLSVGRWDCQYNREWQCQSGATHQAVKAKAAHCKSLPMSPRNRRSSGGSAVIIHPTRASEQTLIFPIMQHEAAQDHADLGRFFAACDPATTRSYPVTTGSVSFSAMRCCNPSASSLR